MIIIFCRYCVVQELPHDKIMFVVPRFRGSFFPSACSRGRPLQSSRIMPSDEKSFRAVAPMSTTPAPTTSERTTALPPDVVQQRPAVVALFFRHPADDQGTTPGRTQHQPTGSEFYSPFYPTSQTHAIVPKPTQRTICPHLWRIFPPPHIAATRPSTTTPHRRLDLRHCLTADILDAK